MTLVARIETLEKKVAELERELAERPTIDKIENVIIEKLKFSGIRV